MDGVRRSGVARFRSYRFGGHCRYNFHANKTWARQCYGLRVLRANRTHRAHLPNLDCGRAAQAYLDIRAVP